ncbi:patatin-like phospholipase family protein [Gemmata sp. JC717]|uniref:patatin-like phospholipase family protein n=1 Tax=Gemmata algarum TaxID=2975278 RepID=UPI0021BB1E53|nr:patatin-like phospholipase family protein [Gemmata algarum]MDY3557013.1 patatin-like phospholipase family protein [Gemmata algarum]
MNSSGDGRSDPAPTPNGAHASAAPLSAEGTAPASKDLAPRLGANAPVVPAPPAAGERVQQPCAERGAALAAITAAVTWFGGAFKRRNFSAHFASLIGWFVGRFDWLSTPFRSHALYCGFERRVRWLIGSPLLTGQIALYLAIAWGVIGSELGLTDLFWNENWWSQFWVGVGTAWLFGTVLFVNILLHGFAPDHLPDEPTETDWCRWRVYARSLFPSLNPGVRRVGRWMLYWLIGLGAVLYLGKAIAIKVGEAPTLEVGRIAAGAPVAAPAKSDAGGLGWDLFPHYGLWFLVGYVSSFVTIYLISLFDAAVELREKVALEKWLISPGEMTPCAGDVAPAAHPTAYQQHTLRLLHAMAITLGFSILATLGVVLLWVVVVYEFPSSIDPRWGLISPAILLSLFLMLLDVVGGLVAFRVRGARTLGAALLVVVAVLNLNSVSPNKMTFPDIADDQYDVDKRLRLGSDEYLTTYRKREPAGGLVGGEEFLKQFNKKGDKPRLVLIATSGGGIRAAVWTGVVLEGLEAEFDGSSGKPAIRDNVKIIAGASGGMVGAAAYVGNFDAGPLPQKKRDSETGLLPFSGRLAEDSLTPVVQTMVLRDFTWNILPGRHQQDRGRTLEWAWDENFANTGRNAKDKWGEWVGGSPFLKTFAELRGDKGARTGDWGAARPALIFTPVMVEDSKRLFVSNLNLDAVAVPRAHRLDTSPDLDLTGVEFFRLFPGASAFTVRTAARMSATFPVVSPAVPLPVTPTRRVVDAGYFDNYGIDVLANWLLVHQKEVRANTSGVLLIQVRAYPLEGGGRTFESDAQSPFDLIIGAVSAPLQAVLTARSWAAYHRNNALLGEVDRVFRDAAKDRPFFTTVTFEQQREAALSWYMTKEQKMQVIAGFYQKQRDGTWAVREDPKPLYNVRQKLDAIREWFGKP